MARPRTHQSAARTHAITVRVTQDTHARLTSEAAQIGTSIAGLVESYITKGCVKVETSAHPPSMHPALIAELKRIGTDLNHIAYAANANMMPKAEEIASSMRELIQLMLKDEILSNRAAALRKRTIANDSAPPSTRDQFQRVVQIRTERQEG